LQAIVQVSASFGHFKRLGQVKYHTFYEACTKCNTNVSVFTFMTQPSKIWWL